MSDRFSRHLRLDLLYGGLGRTVHGERAMWYCGPSEMAARNVTLRFVLS